MMNAVISNAAHPEYGAATIPFPIPRDEYDHCIGLLTALEIGGAVKQDCRIDELQHHIPILERLEKTVVNVDELDYLAKRLDSFTNTKRPSFKAWRSSWEYPRSKTSST